jgi:nitrite reductase/ring-hydroxylating ferredoxin subunit
MSEPPTPTSGAPFVTVARVGDLAPGDVVAVEVAGRAIALGRDRDRYFAMQRRCLHQGGDLSEGLVSRGHLICPVHGWRFDVATGCLDVSAETCLATYAVRVVGDAIQIDPTPRRRTAAPAAPAAPEGEP